jgi:L-type amino acid transporter 5
MIAIPTVVVIYMLTNISYFLVLSPQEVANSQTIAITFSDKIFRPSLSWMLPVFIAFSTFGSLSASVLGYSRVYYASARDGNLPDMFATINVKYYSPLTSTFLIVSYKVCLVAYFC